MNNPHLAKAIFIAFLLLVTPASAPLASMPQNSDKKPIVFKQPSGYMTAPFGHLGKMFLDPKKPAGMFVGYSVDGQDMDGFKKEMQEMVTKMFLHDAKDITWISAPLPPHQAVEESGTLFSASDDKMEIQLAFYVRSEGVAYGYFGMRHKKGGGEDAKFLDAAGKGLKAFDEFAKSISSK